MAAMRLSRLQKRILRWLDAAYQRTNGGLANSHQEFVLILPHAKGNISRSLRALEKRGGLPLGARRAGRPSMSSSHQEAEKESPT